MRNVQKFLRLQGVKVSHVAVLKWIKKYVTLMNQYLEKIKPNVSDTWRADELYIKIKGDMKYLFAIMDDETRFWIAQEIADSKYTHDARTLFKAGVKVAGKKPVTLITDGLPAYHDAYNKEFWTQKKDTRTQHIRHITIREDHNNNKMERMNGEVRDRDNEGSKVEEHGDSHRLSVISQLSKATRRAKRQNPFRGLWNKDRRTEQMDNNNSEC